MKTSFMPTYTRSGNAAKHQYKKTAHAELVIETELIYN